MIFEHLCERLDDRMVVNAFEHQEANGAIGGGDQQNGVYPGGVIWCQESATARGNKFLPTQVQPVEGVGGNPQHQTQQGIRQEPKT